jgi:iron complex outermembrane recepter protein
VVLAGVALISALLGIPAAQAQGTSVSATAGNSETATETSGLEEIVVTAERREVNLQKTAIAITALSGEVLQTEGKNTIDEALMLVPGVEIQGGNGGGPPKGASMIYIRGIGQALGADPAVSLNVDGVYQSDGTGGTQFDLARIEVLQGPQGTLYGRNSTAGSVNIVTNDPSLDGSHAYAALQYGNYNAIRMEAMANLPLSGDTALRTAFLWDKHSGYLSSGSDDDDTVAGRAKFLYRPSDDIQLLLTGDIAHFGGRGTGLAEYPVNASNPWTSNPADQVGASDSKKYSIYGRLDWNLGWGVLTFQPSYYRYDTNIAIDPLGAASELVPTDTHNWEFTQEMRLASPKDSTWNWVAGIYHLYYRINDVSVFGDHLANGIYEALSAQNAVNSPNDTNSWAVFGQTTYPVTDALRVTGGLRFSDDTKTLTASSYTASDTLDPTVPSVTARTSNSAVTFRAGVEYDLAPASLLYANVSNGYKSGGINYFGYASTTAFDAPNTYRPEKLLAYEVGTKNRFINDTLQFNADAYYYKYEDMQVFVVGPPIQGSPGPSTDVVNAAKARLYGVETETQWAITSNDRLSVSVAYEDTKFEQFIYDSFFYGVPPTFAIDRTGQSLADAPKWTEIAGYEHVFHFSGGAALSAGGAIRFLSSHYASIEPTTDAIQPSYHKTDLHVTYTTTDGKWSATTFVNNVENVATRTFIQNIPPADVYRVRLAPPRTFGARIAVHF